MSLRARTSASSLARFPLVCFLKQKLAAPLLSVHSMEGSPSIMRPFFPNLAQVTVSLDNHMLDMTERFEDAWHVSSNFLQT